MLVGPTGAIRGSEPAAAMKKLVPSVVALGEASGSPTHSSEDGPTMLPVASAISKKTLFTLSVPNTFHARTMRPPGPYAIAGPSASIARGGPMTPAVSSMNSVDGLRVATSQPPGTPMIPGFGNVAWATGVDPSSTMTADDDAIATYALLAARPTTKSNGGRVVH